MADAASGEVVSFATQIERDAARYRAAGDPIAPIVEIMSRLARKLDSHEIKMDGLLSTIENAAAGQLADRAAAELPFAVRRLVLQQWRAMWCAAAGMAVILLIAGVVGGIWWDRTRLTWHCGVDANNQRVCYAVAPNPPGG